MKTVYLAGGCFWGVQHFFDQFSGVISTETGYANGGKGDVTYGQVCASGSHAETVRVDFDDEIISLEQLLEYYFMVIDPFSINKQGEDMGAQYRTGIYYSDLSLKESIDAFIKKKTAELGAPLAVEVAALTDFCSAEEYHQKYLEKNPNGYCHIGKEMFEIEMKN